MGHHRIESNAQCGVAEEEKETDINGEEETAGGVDGVGKEGWGNGVGG